MKKINLLLCTSVMAITITLASCGGKTDKEASDKNVSAEMTAFMGMLEGKSEATEAALTKYSADGLDKKDMGMYDLKDPKVIATEKDCYTLEAKSGMTVRTYVLCWEAGKIKSIEDKGMR